jgi:hypothetical protein
MSPSVSAATKTTIVIVSKTCVPSECIVEPKGDTTIQELSLLLSKKCGFRTPEGFSCYHTWKYKNKRKYSFETGGGPNNQHVPKYIYVDLWAKTDGRAGQENKYELPPPVDEMIIYGSMALVARIDKENAVNLTIDLWEKIYEKLFGGFEDLAATAAEDENEIDELESVPAHKKTSNGYLKDGFVVEDETDDTPKCKKVTRSGRGGKKPKSESTESEFITETETESGTPASNSLNGSDQDGEGEEVLPPIPITKIVAKRSGAVKPRKNAKKPASGAVKSKKIVEETNLEEEIESELSEDSYD